MTELLYTAGAVLSTPAGPLPLIANFTYTDTDPMAVSVTFTVEIELDCGHVVTDQQTWVFARDLLDTALATGREVGDGDVRLCCDLDANILRLWLLDIHGIAHPILIEVGPVMDFMEAALRAVPAHEEQANVDTAIERLLEGSWER